MIPAKRNALQSTARIGRPPHPEPYCPCTYYLPTALANAIRDEAERRSLPQSRVVLEALRKGLGIPATRQETA